MITLAIRNKLIAFAIVTVTTLTVLAVGYMRLPESFGIGVYNVRLELPAAGGLYPSAQVSYRGAPVGIVTNMEANDRGAVATLQLEDDVDIPVGVEAQVRSMSAIGEQYVDLLGQTASSSTLGEGSVITADHVVLPVSTVDTVRSVDQFMSSLPTDALASAVDELSEAYGDGYQDLGRVLDAASSLQAEATANLPATMELVRDLEPVLETQVETAPDTARALDHLRTITGRVARNDDALHGLLSDGPAVMDQTGELARGLIQPLANVLAGARTIANVLSIYDSSLLHLLTVFPAVVAGFQSAVDTSGEAPVLRLSFKLNLNDPPSCTVGYPEGGQTRDPHDIGPKAPPPAGYCKVAPDDPRVIRGARNLPCPNTKARAATPADCKVRLPRFEAPGKVRIAFVDPAGGRALTSSGETISIDELGESPPRESDATSLFHNRQ